MKFRITEECVSCGTCGSVCKNRAIRMGFPCVITNKCIGCGACAEACPIEAIVPVKDEEDKELN